jgi:hypothetical protein
MAGNNNTLTSTQQIWYDQVARLRAEVAMQRSIQYPTSEQRIYTINLERRYNETVFSGGNYGVTTNDYPPIAPRQESIGNVIYNNVTNKITWDTNKLGGFVGEKVGAALNFLSGGACQFFCV